MRREAAVSVYSLVFVIEREKLGDPHSVLVGEERFVSRRIRHQVEKLVWDELNQAGLARGNRLDGDFRDMVATIQRAGTEYYGWITSREGSYGLLLATSGSDAVALVRTGETVSIEPVRPEYIVDEIVGRLPEVPAANGKPISVLAADFSHPDASKQSYLDGGASSRHPEARRLDALLRAPRLGGGKLYAARRDHTGRRHRCETWLSFLDLDHGRWLTYQTDGQEPSINAVPGTPRLLARKLSELR